MRNAYLCPSFILETMRKRVVFLLTSLFFSISSLLAQDVPDEIIGAFKKGNSQDLNRYLCDKVDVIIDNNSTTLDKAKTAEKMAAFFGANKVSGFSVNHKGKRDESSFVIGTLTTSNGNYRVNCFIKKNKDNYIIHQIRIDKINE